MRFVCSIGIFLNYANLICRSTDISRCFRGSLRLRDNESRLYRDLALVKFSLSLRNTAFLSFFLSFFYFIYALFIQLCHASPWAYLVKFTCIVIDLFYVYSVCLTYKIMNVALLLYISNPTAHANSSGSLLYTHSWVQRSRMKYLLNLFLLN